MQFVQPKPSSLVYTQSEPIQSITQTTLTCGASVHDVDSVNQLGPTVAQQSPLKLRSKRPHSIRSPANSPGKRSPLPKKQRRMRTGTEGKRSTVTTIDRRETVIRECPIITEMNKPTLTLDSFKLSDRERHVLTDITTLFTEYMLQKVANNDDNKTTIDIKSYLALVNSVSAPEPSIIVYFKVLHQRCDDKGTLLNIINDLHEELITTNKMKWAVLEGDQATYNLLQSIKKDYGPDLAWVIPFPGDWHFLKNFQEVLLKIYFDAGLRDLAKASGCVHITFSSKQGSRYIASS